MIITLAKTIGGTSYSVAMPNTRNVTLSVEAVGTESVMANGDIVIDAVGTRRVWTAEWDRVPAEKLQLLYYMLARTRVVTVAITNISGVSETITATVTPTSSKYFSDKAAFSKWHGVSLTIKERTLQSAVVS